MSPTGWRRKERSRARKVPIISLDISPTGWRRKEHSRATKVPIIFLDISPTGWHRKECSRTTKVPIIFFDGTLPSTDSSMQYPISSLSRPKHRRASATSQENSKNFQLSKSRGWCWNGFGNFLRTIRFLGLARVALGKLLHERAFRE